MTDPAARAAFALAVAESDATGDPIPEERVAAIRGLGVEAGAATQVMALAQTLAAGGTLAGWKVGMTSGPNRDKMGVGVRPFGFVRGSRLFRSDATLPLDAIPSAGIEPELGVRIGKAVGGADVSRADILDAIEAFLPCFEIVQRRHSPGGDGVSVAAGLSQWGVVVGEADGPWSGSPSDLVVTLDRGGERIAEAGPGFSIDDPLDSLRALCGGLARFGLGLLPGQHVITGAFAKSRVEGPGSWRADFAGLGQVAVEFA